MRTAVVLTTINPLNDVMLAIAEHAKKHQWQFVIAGDTISKDIQHAGLDYLSISAQLDMGSVYAKKAPVRNYCRKNLAYLQAIRSGADRVIETDDDNFPYENFGALTEARETFKNVTQGGFVNVCRYFTDNTTIWPRGFSLPDIHRELIAYEKLASQEAYCPVHNGMVDNDPDVDAIYRLLFKLPFNFEHKDRAIAMATGSWCSFNTQNTVFFKDVFPLMYQPATPMFREADILRSFVVQRILWENNAQVLFHSPTVFQKRNPHNYLEDLKEEVRLYAYAGEVANKLEKLSLKSGAKHFHENMIKCYEIYERYQFIKPLEYQLIDAWFKDLSGTVEV